LWMFNPWNGPGGSWAQGNQNIGSAFDFWMLGRYYSGFYAGMNAIPSTATIMFGVMAGQFMMNARRSSSSLISRPRLPTTEHTATRDEDDHEKRAFSTEDRKSTRLTSRHLGN